MNSQFLDFSIIAKQEINEILSNCEGQNRQKIFLLYPKNNTAELPFLKKILAAVQLDFQEDTLSLASDFTTTFSLSDLLRATSSTKILIFGFPPAQVGLHLNLTKYQAYHIGNCNYLFADDLASIANNKSLKGLLWKGLQELFPSA